ncbi:flagellar hook-associated protein FlgL [Salinibacter ruber]|uniref:Flagellar hook-associated protein 3 FlgL n=1 Tax=Salinibacter ruber TaxID=146919 RepID=A0A9X2ZP09_9BACT|nr:flagellar hook-associated protein FlgL [Salinibacter ruber]MCS3656217.1 flagellar hook-associated protein 3 FlgL [Salinibacter ruber]MCS3950270.1 flagellar hook-associated protein 3 FlgL [Salinibacter ruber]MCS4117033.1 flagellar hook-associated protein 3 FlgL [Salinibacter ruber]MCS4153873.1 flagellar hook-associated protein 3 FlgL [Salinibacter ruber]MCS4169635.1 flagellar hook-associated protein 3 FlgL [Salinibacter ruber]
MANVSIATNSSVYSGVISDEVPRLQRDISRLREQISSGKRINRPSDDPSSFATAERMKTLGNQLARREESIASARTFVDRTQQELDGLADLFTRAREDGVRAADDTRSADDRAAIANELRSIKDEVVDRMNSTQDGEYIFAGNRTDTQPFGADGSANDAAPINGSLDALDGDRTRPIGKNQDLTINVDGKALAQYDTTAGGDPETITGALDNLIKAVDPADNSPPSGPPDPDISTALGEVEDALDHVISKGSEAGAIGRRLSTAQEQVEAASLEANERRSDAEDTDLATAISELQQRQTQLQAAFQATSSSQQTSLVNFL